VDFAALEALAGRFGRDVFVVDANVPLGLENRCREPERVGVDRLLASRAALERTGTTTLVVDLGTAATFNLVEPPGVFCGGLIAPGLGLALSALHRGTAKLPEVDLPAEPPAAIGLSTDEAILGGVTWVLVGGIERIVRNVTDLVGRRPVVVATGGDAERLRKCGAFFDLVVPGLVLEGLWHVHADLVHRRRPPGERVGERASSSWP
jgi:type III pantothenate kinase